MEPVAASSIQDKVARFVNHLSLVDPTPIGAGLHATVVRATHPVYGLVALRIPAERYIRNANDSFLDASVLLAQELAIYGHISRTSYASDERGKVPVPVPYAHVELNGEVAMLASYVDSDGSLVSGGETGRVLGLLHNLPVPAELQLVCQQSLSFSNLIAERLTSRWLTLKVYVADLPHLPSQAALLSILQPLSRYPSRLLHMDFRAANFRTRAGRIAGVVDWDNALVGPAVIELYRIIEIAHPGDGFLAAYGKHVPPAMLSPVEEAVLRLDAAVMLALVFLSEAPDPFRAKDIVIRVKKLLLMLNGEGWS